MKGVLSHIVIAVFLLVSGSDTGICSEQVVLEAIKLIMDGVSMTCLVNPLRDGWYEWQVTPDRLAIQFQANGRYVPLALPNASEALWSHPSFDRGARTLLFAHGFNGSPYHAVDLRLAASVAAMGYNYVALDSTAVFGGVDYSYVAGAVPYVARHLYAFLKAMFAKGLDPSRLHLVGESLGAHLVGMVGRRYLKETGSRLPRITALDPAYPCYTKPGDKGVLNSTDAAYVDVVYTSYLSLQFDERIGHARYYANSRHGLQPGCFPGFFPIFCSHKRAKALFQESTEDMGAFPAKKCSNIREYVCDTNIVSYMGINSDPASRGSYFFKTNGSYPYSLGQAGIL